MKKYRIKSRTNGKEQIVDENTLQFLKETRRLSRYEVTELDIKQIPLPKEIEIVKEITREVEPKTKKG